MSTFLNILYDPDYCGLLVRFIPVWLVGLVLGLYITCQKSVSTFPP